MARSALARGWRILLALLAVAALVALIDLSDHRRSSRARADGYISQLFAGESGLALLAHPLQVSAWRVPGPAGHAVLPDRQSIAQLTAVLNEGASYAHGDLVQVHRFDVAVRFEDESGSMTLLFTRDGTRLQVMRNGNPLSQADTTPVRERLRTLLQQVMAEPASRPGP